MAHRAARDSSRRSRARARSESSELAELFEMAEKGQAGMLGTRAARIRELLLSENHQVRVQTERLLMEQQFGKPYQAGEMTTNETVRYVVEVPPEETKEQWRARQEAARARADEILESVN